MLCLVVQSGLTFCDPIDCSPLGSTVHGNSPGKNTGVSCHALLQGIFPTQGLNPSLPHCRRILYHLSHSVSQFSRSVVSDSLWPHESQHARPPCPSPTPGVYSNPFPLSRWCHPAISSSVSPFSSCPQSVPASGSFPMNHLFAWGGQSTGVSASASVLPVNTQDWSSLGWTGWISLQSKGLSRVFSNTTVQNHPFFGTQLSSQSNSHIPASWETCMQVRKQQLELDMEQHTVSK